MKIYLIRHGADEPGYRGGWSQRGLSDEGRVQARVLGEHLSSRMHEFSVRTIISSDLPRAAETAQEIGTELGLLPIYTSDWRETNNGLLAGMPNDEANRRYPGLYFNTLGMDERYPGGESPQENFNRIRRSFRNLCNQIEAGEVDPNVLLVTHGGVISIIYHLIKGLDWTNRRPLFRAVHTSIHIVESVNGMWQLTSENGTPHLSAS